MEMRRKRQLPRRVLSATFTAFRASIARSRVLLERGFGSLWLEAEISNFAKPSSGHWYFSLKDAAAQVRCCHVPAAKYVVCLHRAGRPKSAGAGPHRAVRAARRVPAHHRSHGGRGARRFEAAVRGIERQARSRRPVRCRAQAPAAEPAPAHRRHHFAHRRRGPRHPARAGAALSGGSGTDLPRCRARRASGGGDRRGRRVWPAAAPNATY